MLLGCACGGIGELILIAIVTFSCLASYLADRFGFHLPRLKNPCKCECHEHEELVNIEIVS